MIVEEKSEILSLNRPTIKDKENIRLQLKKQALLKENKEWMMFPQNDINKPIKVREKFMGMNSKDQSKIVQEIIQIQQGITEVLRMQGHSVCSIQENDMVKKQIYLLMMKGQDLESIQTRILNIFLKQNPANQHQFIRRCYIQKTYDEFRQKEQGIWVKISFKSQQPVQISIEEMYQIKYKKNKQNFVCNKIKNVQIRQNHPELKKWIWANKNILDQLASSRIIVEQNRGSNINKIRLFEKFIGNIISQKVMGDFFIIKVASFCIPIMRTQDTLIDTNYQLMKMNNKIDCKFKSKPAFILFDHNNQSVYCFNKENNINVEINTLKNELNKYMYDLDDQDEHTIEAVI